MREPRPDWSPLGVNFKILDEPPHLFYIRVPHPPGCGIEKIDFSIGVKHKKPDPPDFPSGRLFTVSSEDEWQIYRGFMLGENAKDYELVGEFSRLIMVNLLDRSVILFNPNNQKPRLIFKPKVLLKLLDENSG